jgi:hypothetical protein
VKALRKATCWLHKQTATACANNSMLAKGQIMVDEAAMALAQLFVPIPLCCLNYTAHVF